MKKEDHKTKQNEWKKQYITQSHSTTTNLVGCLEGSSVGCIVGCFDGCIEGREVGW